MRLIWTKSNLPLSVLIRWGLGEPVSHFAIVFDEKVVFESNLLGTHIKWISTFTKHATIVYEKHYDFDLEQEEAVWKAICDQYDDKPYDYMGFLYFAWRGFLKRVFGVPMPDRNAWSAPDSYLCSGLAKALKEACPEDLIPGLEQVIDAEMTSPYQLYLKIEGASNG